MPIEGDLRPGGRFQFNAGGEVTVCEPPERLGATWEMHDEVSWVEMLFTHELDDWTRLTLTNTAVANPFWDQFGSGAVGVGWELGLVGLALYLKRPDIPKIDEDQFAKSSGGKSFMQERVRAWGEADIARGEDPAQAKRTADFYTGGSASKD